MDEDNSARIDKLESHVAHLDRLVEALNEVVIGQGKLLDRLNKEFQRQVSIMKALEMERMNPDEKPPHYQ
jgi:SlyX protein